MKILRSIVKIFGILLIILIISYSSVCYSQFIIKNHTITGKIIDSISQKGIPNALIAIIETEEFIFTDTLGNFKFSLNENKHIKISSLGYQSKTLQLKDHFNKENNFTNSIKLLSKSYLLKEVVIHNLGTWEEFKHKIITGDISYTKYWKDKHVSKMFKNTYKGVPDTANYGYIPLMFDKPNLNLNDNPFTFIPKVINYPVQLLYYELVTSSKKYKNEKKLYNMIKRQELIDENKLNYNEELIADITEIKNPDSIKLFKSWCDLHISLSKPQTELTVIQQVIELYDKYKKRNIQ